jgi:hypothetical protein
MVNVLAAVRQLDRLDDSPLDRVSTAHANASTEAEERFAQLLEDEGVDPEKARLLAAVALVRFIENVMPDDLFRLVHRFDLLLR